MANQLNQEQDYIGLQGKLPQRPGCQQMLLNQETFRLTSEEEIQRECNQQTEPKDHRAKGRHQLHQCFDAVGGLKPSLLYSNSLEEEYQYTNQAPKHFQKEDQQKKTRKNRRKTHCYPKKIFYESGSEEQPKQIDDSKKRKMTMDFSGNGGGQLVIFPEISNIRPEKEDGEQREAIDIKWSDEQAQEVRANRDEQEIVGITDLKQLLLFDDSESEQGSMTHQQTGRLEQKLNSRVSPSSNQVALTHSDQNEVIENILDPSKKMLQNQKRLTQTMLTTASLEERHTFLKTGIGCETRLVFEAVVDNNNIFTREYSLWLDGGDKKMLLMKGKKNVKITEDYYVIQEYQDFETTETFLGKLNSNFMRQEHILSNEPDYAELEQKQVYAKFTVSQKLNDKPYFIVVFPGFDKLSHSQKVFNIGSDPESLKTLFRIREGQISYLSCSKLEETYQRDFMARHNLIKTRKSVALVDKFGAIKVYIGKTASRRYKIFAGPGMSPFLVFAIFIVMIQS